MKTTMTPDAGADGRRVVPLSAVHNFRDLGGYPTEDGGSTRWGRVFRADNLGRLTPADVEALRPIGLRTVIDLRTPAEAENHGRFPFEDYPLDYHLLPIVDQTWAVEGRVIEDDPHEFLARAYRDMLAVGESRLVDAVRLIASADASPVVFHCAAGKDRTGLLAAFVLAASGVGLDTIVADYQLTEPAMVTARAWIKVHDPAMHERIVAAHPSLGKVVGSALAEVLTELVDRHGSMLAYLASLGLEADVIDAIRTLLVEPGDA